jgi:translocation and assembly module TamB
MRPREKALRIARIALKALGVVLLVVALLVVLVVLSANLPFARAFIVERTNAALATTFAGRVEVKRLGAIDFDGVRGVDAKIFDRSGREVVDARGLDVRLPWPSLVWDLLVEKPDPLVVTIDGIELEHAEIALIDDGNGTPTLATTFEPRTPAASTEPSPRTFVELRSVRLNHVWVHGKLASAPPIDVDLRKVATRLDFSEQTAIELESADLEARGLPQRLDPKGNLRGTVTLGPKPEQRKIDTTFEGEVAAVHTRVAGKLDNDAIDATLSARAPASALAALSPALAPHGTTELTAKAHGTLARLLFEVELASPGGHANGRGKLAIGDATSVELELSADDLNAALLFKDAPPSRVTLEFEGRARMAGETLSASYELVVPPSLVSGQALPRLASSGKIEQRGKDAPLRADGELHADEAGAVTVVGYSFTSGRASVLELESLTALESPERLRALAPGLALSGFLEARARLDLDSNVMEARADLRRATLTHPAVKVGGFAISAHATGPFSNPALMVRGLLRNTTALGQRFTTIELKAAGGPERSHVEARLAGEDLRTYALASELELAPRLALSHLRLGVSQSRDALSLAARRVDFGETVRVKGLEIEARGTARGSLVYGRGLEELEIEAKEFDVSAALRVLGIESPLERGTVDLVASYHERHGTRKATIEGRARNLDFGRVRDGKLAVRAQLDEHELNGRLEAELEHGATGLVSFEKVTVGKLAFDDEALRAMSGKVAVSGELELGQLAELFALERAEGTVRIDATLERPRPGDALPDLSARVSTRGLGFLTKRKDKSEIETPGEARKAEPFELEGIDIDANLNLDSKNGKTRLAFRGFDDKGDLLRLEGETTLPQSLSRALEPDVATLPFKASAELPERRLSDLPDVIPVRGLKGSALVKLSLEGTGANPEIGVAASFRGLRPERSEAPPLDGDLEAKFGPERGKVRFEVEVKKRRVGDLNAEWEGDLRKLAAADPAVSPLKGKAALEFFEFPIAALPGAADLSAKGSVTGRVALDDYGTDAKVTGKLGVSPLALAEARFERVNVDIGGPGKTLRANASLRQKKGWLKGSLEAGMDFGARMFPSIRAPLKANLEAREFRLTGLHALMPGVVSELDGRLDANMRGEFGGGPAQVAGAATLRGGVFQQPTIGQRFHHIDADVKLEPNRARLTRLVARGSSGRLSATGHADFAGLALQGAEANVRIDSDHKIPITFEGVGFGDASGKIDVNYRAASENAPSLLRVKVSDVEAVLPEAAGHTVQELAPAEHVSVGFHRKDGTFAALPLQPMESDETEPGTPLVVLVELGKKVRVQRANQLDVELGGEIKVRLAEETEISGQIQLRSGTLDIQGKLFHIERGVITFSGVDPSNPMIVALARWDSPAEYRVYAEYTGTATDGKLRLTSEPALTQDQIVSLLMFGSPEGTTGSNTSAASAAFGVVGGTATKGINRVLSRFSELDVDARVDTSSGESRPEIVVQVSPRVSARVTRALGDPGPGEPPDRTFATLDLRIAGRWSVATRVGDRGASALDLVWRLRY